MTRFLLEPFAGIGVADRQCEEAGSQRQHQNVQHGLLLVCARSISRTTLSESRRCHPDDRFSRRPDRQSYRNLIKAARPAGGIVYAALIFWSLTSSRFQTAIAVILP